MLADFVFIFTFYMLNNFFYAIDLIFWWFFLIRGEKQVKKWHRKESLSPRSIWASWPKFCQPTNKASTTICCPRAINTLWSNILFNLTKPTNQYKNFLNKIDKGSQVYQKTCQKSISRRIKNNFRIRLWSRNWKKAYELFFYKISHQTFLFN